MALNVFDRNELDKFFKIDRELSFDIDNDLNDDQLWEELSKSAI